MAACYWNRDCSFSGFFMAHVLWEAWWLQGENTEWSVKRWWIKKEPRKASWQEVDYRLGVWVLCMDTVVYSLLGKLCLGAKAIEQTWFQPAATPHLYATGQKLSWKLCAAVQWIGLAFLGSTNQQQLALPWGTIKLITPQVCLRPQNCRAQTHVLLFCS